MWMSLFIISSIVNVIFLFYVKWLLSTIKSISEDLEFLSEKITDYVSHVGSLHELEMFYGEPTLQSLMEHGKDLVKDISDVDLVINEGIENEEEEA
tara:strand:- start:253 stop:540 length:288 start_codon:yes stop_codon:yes gene_type:complete